MQEVFRIEPNLPSEAYVTFGLVAPRKTHTRVATCQEVECQNYQRGWQTQIDTSTQLGQRQALYISTKSGRRFVTERMGAMLIFTFYAEQRCFSEHRVMLGRPPLFTIKNGDWRTRGSGRVVNGQEWIDRFAGNQESLARERG